MAYCITKVSDTNDIDCHLASNGDLLVSQGSRHDVGRIRVMQDGQHERHNVGAYLDRGNPLTDPLKAVYWS